LYFDKGMENLSRFLPAKSISPSQIRFLRFIFIGAVAFLIIFSRRPDAILNPQFWAEDGRVWYAMAYNDGALGSLFVPESSYYQTISRLIAALAQLFPLAAAPLVFNLFAVFSKILVVYFLVSERFSRLVPSLKVRILLAFIYLALPNSYEVNANLSNVQWHLALLSFFILIAEPGEKIFRKAFDVCVLLLSALSGPFCLFLFPIGLFYWWRARQRWTLYLVFILFLGCIVQGITILSIERVTKVPLGASFNLFSEIIGGQVFFSSIFGGRIYGWLYRREFWTFFPAFIAALVGFGWLAAAVLKAPLELKLFIALSVLICAGALVSPAASETEPQWRVLSYPLVGTRYWFIPIFCFLTVLVYFAATAKKLYLKRAAVLLLTLAPIGIVSDWKYPPFKDYEFRRYAAEFENVPAGTEFQIPINPDWKMKLTKREDK
jgi:hypothetical protein